MRSMAASARSSGRTPPTTTAAATRQYELVFAAGDYFAAQGVALPSPRFIDRVTIAFGIADPSQNYHVPLVVTPWSYSTYRGS
jgi:5-hydroxyisourate hydrolase